MPKCDFNKVPLPFYWNHTWKWVFSESLLHIFRIPFYKNTYGELLLGVLPQTRYFQEFCKNPQGNTPRLSPFLLKSDLHSPKKTFICINESPLKLMENAFYFILRALFVLKLFKLLSWLFGHLEKRAWLER